MGIPKHTFSNALWNKCVSAHAVARPAFAIPSGAACIRTYSNLR
ncbi:hypothetical protein X781_8320 [Mannheimia sp. USDA-ARS-USMARC-1261]|nr:hypothetical protein X781_8320 [Mannheimia sp. USDA-ARS-USMARC-1261]